MKLNRSTITWISFEVHFQCWQWRCQKLQNAYSTCWDIHMQRLLCDKTLSAQYPLQSHSVQFAIGYVLALLNKATVTTIVAVHWSFIVTLKDGESHCGVRKCTCAHARCFGLVEAQLKAVWLALEGLSRRFMCLLKLEWGQRILQFSCLWSLLLARTDSSFAALHFVPSHLIPSHPIQFGTKIFMGWWLWCCRNSNNMGY